MLLHLKLNKMYTKKKYDSFKKFEDPKIITSAIDKEMLDILNICRSRMNINDTTTEFKESIKFLDNMITPIPEVNRRTIFHNSDIIHFVFLIITSCFLD